MPPTPRNFFFFGQRLAGRYVRVIPEAIRPTNVLLSIHRVLHLFIGAIAPVNNYSLSQTSVPVTRNGENQKVYAERRATGHANLERRS